MAKRDYIPAIEKYLLTLSETAKNKIAVSPDIDISVEKNLLYKLSNTVKDIFAVTGELEIKISEADATVSATEKAFYFCKNIIPVMEKLRQLVDCAETMTDSAVWPVPSYGELTYYTE